MDELTRLSGPAERMLTTVAEALPRVGLAGLVVVGGLFGAMLARRITLRLVARLGIDALAERAGVARLLYAVQIRGGIGAVVANLLAVVVVLLTSSTAAEMVGLPGVAEGVGSIVEFLPRLVSAGVVALFGFAAAEFSSRIAEGFGQRRSDIVAPKFVANLVYYVVLAVVLTTAVQHLGMDTGLIDLLMGVLLGAVVGSGSLALAWSARLLLQDALTRPYVSQYLSPGVLVTVGTTTGTVEAIGTVTIAIRQHDGSLQVLPIRRLLAEDGFTLDALDPE